MRRFLASFASLACFALAALPLRAETTRPLNVVMIFSDDLNCCLGTYGHPIVKSPNIDRLAARGMRFDRAYVQYPVCNPSRTSLLSGLRPDTTKVLSNREDFRQTIPDATMLPDYYRQRGYYTALIGKIFHTAELSQGQADLVVDPQATPRGLTGEGRQMADRKGFEWCRWLASEGGDEDLEDGQSATRAIQVLDEQTSRPFFLAVGFRRPHDPYIAPKGDFAHYPLDKLKLPEVPPGYADSLPKPALPHRVFDEELTRTEQLEFMRAYYAGVTYMDRQVGRLLDALDRKGLWENTVVVFVGDHGFHLGEHGWWNKSTTFEAACRAPLIVWSPGAAGMGKPCRRLVEFVDLYPTLSRLCGSAVYPGEGRSFVPLLRDPDQEWKRAAFSQVYTRKIMGRTVRTERWRYTEWDQGRAGTELYDHNTDPGEMYNLASSEKSRDTLTDMQKLLRGGWQALEPRTYPPPLPY